MGLAVTRRDVLGFRLRAQQLDRAHGTVADTAVLDLGVQDTGPDGGLWTLAIRGVDVGVLADDELATLWTIRGAPHLYRREDLPELAAAVEPLSDADAGKRILNASNPLRAAGIANLEALDAVATTMREVVTRPMVKGEVSRQVADRMPEPYLRFCRPCNAVHLYELPFRLAAFRAGLELHPGTSPPVLEPIPGFAPADQAPARLDVVRAYLRLLGPATPKHVADYLEAPAKDVRAHWPEDAVEVDVEGETRWLLDQDVDALAGGRELASDRGTPGSVVRLLGPFDLFLQAKDRPLLVDDPARAKALWPVLGRPGAVLDDGEIAGTWRPRKSGSKLGLQVELWDEVPRTLLEEQAERLAAFRGVTLAGLDIS